VKSKNLEQIMFLVASQFERMPDGAQKTALSMQLFGKSGANLIPTLNLGVRGLADLRETARKTGNVMSGQTVDALDNFGDQLDEAKGQLTGLRNQGIAALLPLLKDMLTRFQAWIEANRELIVSKIKDVVYALAEALKLLGTAIAFAVEHWEIFLAILAVVAIKAAIAWAAMLGPVGLVGAAIIALGLTIYKFRDKIGAALRAVGRFFVDLWQDIKAGVQAAIEAVGGVFESIKQFRDDIVGVFVGIGKAIIKVFTDAFDWVANKAKETVGAIRNAPVIRQVVDFVAGEQTGGPKFENVVQASAASARSRAALDSTFGGRFSTPGVGGAGVTTNPAVNNQSSYAITVNAANADAKEVAKVVTDKIREHDEQQRRRMAASLGLR
jgi:phage-related protein